jgi:diguanylate cyclase (GGDEF)-like protein/PAS domain S-box-containing protein
MRHGDTISLDAWRNRLSSTLPSVSQSGQTRPDRYALAIILLGIAVAARFLIASQNAGLQYVTFFPAVALTAFFGGVGPAIFAGLAGCFLANYLFFLPIDHFHLSRQALMSGLVFLADELLVCGIIVTMQHNYQRYVSASQALIQSESSYQSLFDNMLNGVTYCRVIFEQGKPVDFVYLNVNRAFKTLTGLESVVGKKASEVIPGILERDPHLIQLYGRVASSGRQEQLEFFMDTLQQWLMLSVYRIHDNLVASVFDVITERKNAEIHLRIAAAAFDAHDAIVITDANKVILQVNRAFTETTGYTAEEAVGKNPGLLKSGRHDDAFYEDMWRTIEKTGSWQGEIWDRRKNGEVYPKWLTISAVRGRDHAVTHYVAIHTDITERKAFEDKIKDLAFYDPLTRLANRHLMMDRLQQATRSRSRGKNESALLFIDMDNFKVLNDTLGHDKGDKLLQEVALRLSTHTRKIDTVARLGGDEFVVMLENLSTNSDEAAAQVKAIAEKILYVLSQPYLLSGHEYHTSASIGIALFGDQHKEIEELLKQADIAMYQAKASGRNTLRFFDPELQAALNARAELVEHLRQGIRDKHLFLYYQPQVENNRVIGAEALVRWRHPERGIVSPDVFISLAEETGLILPLGQQVLENACAQLTAWSALSHTAQLCVAVNVSAQQFRQSDFVDRVLSVLDRSRADPHKLKLELTEGMLIENIEDVILKMNALRSVGITFSLDDFGTGYSSLSYLKQLPLSQLKIDRSFVNDVLHDSNAATIAHTIVALGHNLGLKVIAEGVETEEQKNFLSSHGCHAFQGFLFSRPLPADEFERFIR